MTKVLQVENLAKCFHSRQGFLTGKTTQVLHDINFSLGQGEIVALVGESGSGKSTIAKLLLQLERADEGHIQFQATSNAGSEGAQRSKHRPIQMIFQDPFAALNPTQQVRYILERPLRIHHKLSGQALKKKMAELLTEVGLTPPEEIMDRYPHSLSGGQRQRVVIARALACKPKILIADEPTSMLDVSIRIGILNLLASLRDREQLTILLITHDLASAAYLADRVLVLLGGRIVEEGKTDQVIRNPRHPYTQALLASVSDWNHDHLNKGDEHKSPQQSGCCPYLSRCPRQLSICASIPPDLLAAGNSEHRIRCHLTNQSPSEASLS